MEVQTFKFINMGEEYNDYEVNEEWDAEATYAQEDWAEEWEDEHEEW